MASMEIKMSMVVITYKATWRHNEMTTTYNPKIVSYIKLNEIKAMYLSASKFFHHFTYGSLSEAYMG
jgi:flagellar biosynthesis protein FliQ